MFCRVVATLVPGIAMSLSIRTKRDIAKYAAIITAVAVISTASFVHFATFRLLNQQGYSFAMVLAIGLPLVIALPIATIALFLVRMITAGLDKIEAFVKFDPLTGTLARSYFMEVARRAFSGGGALLLVDADHFKRINDSHGHDVGDEALRVLGATLNFAVPDTAAVGRIGGEEFAIFLPGADRSAAERTAAAINAVMRENGRVIAGKPLGMTVSIGVAMVTPGSSLTLLFKEADETLYSAKHNGRDRYLLGRSCTGAQPASASALA